MTTSHDSLCPTELGERLARIEERLSSLESQLQAASRRQDFNSSLSSDLPQPEAERLPAKAEEEREEALELALGQRWFAHVGILVLALGAAFTLSLPFAGLPPIVPSLMGYTVVGCLFLVSWVWRTSFELLSRYLYAAAMALLYFATLRLFYFGVPVLSADSTLGRAILLAAVVINLAIAFRRQSPFLLALAFPMGCLTALLLHSAVGLFALLTLLSAVVTYAWVRYGWSWVLLAGTPAVFLTHLLWALQVPTRGGEFQFVKEPSTGLFVLLLYAVILASGPLLRQTQKSEDAFTVVSSLLISGLGYTLFVLHSIASFDAIRVPSNLAATAVFLGLAALFWKIQKSQLTCFFYAMTGYMALSVAILGAFTPPNVFVWLSVQSLIVVATALWFCSPFIVVANFFIYLAIVATYMVLTKQETGVSLVFGLVALLSARTLNWQKERLHLKTGKMRNAYLAGAFIVFPYALYHLVPRAYVALSWVCVAGLYYLLNLLIQNQKYRWMGHFTLLITVFYVLFVGIVQLPSTQRIVSLLLLGTVLVVISLVFTRKRTRGPASPSLSSGE